MRMPHLPLAALTDRELLAWCADSANGPPEQRYDAYSARFGPAAAPTLHPVHRRLRAALRDGTVEHLEPFLIPLPPDTDDVPLRDRRLTSEATRQMFDLWENGVLA